jgi:predicted MPP superfamily phosphohydrolase
MLHHLAGWLRSHGRDGLSHRRWAHWLGRNWARLSYGYSVEPTWLELNHFEIPVPGLPESFAGFRIVQMTDFHCSRQVTPAYLGEAVALAQGQAADLIVLTGDFVHQGFRYVDHAANALASLSAPCGVFAVLGNHDYSVRNSLGLRRHRHLHRSVGDALTRRGIRVLRNETVPLMRGDSQIFLTGVEDLWSRSCDLDRALNGLDRKVPRIILAHNPRTIEQLHGRRCDLMLSGHTHGGQVNWPGVGRPVLGKRARRFAEGLYQVNESYLYVNKGVGFGWRFRFGVRPEVSVTTLCRA